VIPVEFCNRPARPCCAQDLDYYPMLVNWHIEGSRPGQFAIKVTEFVDPKTAKGRAIVPLRLESKAQEAASALQLTGIVTKRPSRSMSQSPSSGSI